MKILFTVVLIFLCLVRLPAQETGTKSFTFRDTVFVPGSKMACPGINFMPASVILTRGAEIYLDSLAAIMKKRPAMKINIGYVQLNWPEGADIYSFERVTSVMDYLVSKGVDKKMINRNAHTIKSDKELDEINELYKKKNYRVEFTIR